VVAEGAEEQRLDREDQRRVVVEEAGRDRWGQHRAPERAHADRLVARDRVVPQPVHERAVGDEARQHEEPERGRRKQPASSSGARSWGLPS
jgi:hypothetical protein